MAQAPALRPLGIGDIIDRVLNVYRAVPLVLLALAAIPYLFFVLVLGAAGLSMGAALLGFAPFLDPDVAPDRLPPAESLAALAAVGIVAIVGGIATALIQSAALMHAASERYLGRVPTIGGSFRAGLRVALPLLGMGLLAFIAFMVMWVGLVVAGALVGEWWSILVTILVALVGTVYLAASWMVAPAVITLERSGPLRGLGRAWRLSEGHRWRVLGLLLLLGVLQVVLSILLSTIFLAGFALDEVGQIVLQQVVNLLASIAWAPIYWGTFAILYYDLRVRKEAFDLQLAAEALPRAP